LALGRGAVPSAVDALGPPGAGQAEEVVGDVGPLARGHHAEGLGDLGGRQGTAGLLMQQVEDAGGRRIGRQLHGRLRGRGHGQVVHALPDLLFDLPELGLQARQAVAQCKQTAGDFGGPVGLVHAPYRDTIPCKLASFECKRAIGECKLAISECTLAIGECMLAIGECTRAIRECMLAIRECTLAIPGVHAEQ